jgi:hypothetical protein
MRCHTISSTAGGARTSTAESLTRRMASCTLNQLLSSSGSKPLPRSKSSSSPPLARVRRRHLFCDGGEEYLSGISWSCDLYIQTCERRDRHEKLTRTTGYEIAHSVFRIGRSDPGRECLRGLDQKKIAVRVVYAVCKLAKAAQTVAMREPCAPDRNIPPRAKFT